MKTIMYKLGVLNGCKNNEFKREQDKDSILKELIHLKIRKKKLILFQTKIKHYVKWMLVIFVFLPSKYYVMAVWPFHLEEMQEGIYPERLCFDYYSSIVYSGNDNCRIYNF